MVWWWLARVFAPLAVFGLALNCSVDDDAYAVAPGASAAGEGGDAGPAAGRDGSGAVSAGGKASGGQANNGNTGNRSGQSGAPGALGGSSGEDGSSPAAGTFGTSGETGSNPNGGTPGEPAGTGGTTTGTGGSSVAPETCDCDDPACGARVCVPAAPAEWSGPILLFEGARAWLPECTGEIGDERFNAGTVPVQEALRCIGCSCGELVGGACSIPYVAYDSSCETELSSGTFTSTCVPPPAANFAFGDFVMSGSCAPEGGTELERNPPSWERVARGCGLSDPRSAGCGDDSICVPEPAMPFEDEICVYQAGDHACPDDYPSQRSYLTTFNDERECEPCTCLPSGTCSSSLTVYNDQDCMVAPPNYTSQNVGTGFVGQCGAINSNISVLAMRVTGENLPNCHPNGGTSKGSVSADDPLTVCCR